MNKTYRSMWSEQAGTWVAVSEIAKSDGRGSRSVRALAAAGLLVAAAGAAHAQVRIDDGTGGSNPTPAPGAVLELGSTQRGLLLSRVALTDAVTWSLAGNTPVEGMVVFNTQASSGVNGLSTGLVAWKGGRWVSVDETPYFHVNSSVAGNSTQANSGATGVDALAAGPNAQATMTSAVAIGDTARATEVYATAVGSTSTAGAVSSTAIGNVAQAFGKNSTAIGANTTAVATSSLAAGDRASASDINSVALGANTQALKKSSLAAGDRAIANGINATALGANSQAQADSALALGDGALAGGTSTVAIGLRATAKGIFTTAIGTDAGTGSTTTNGVFIGDGSGSGSSGDHNSYIGSGSGTQASGSNNSAFGAVAGSVVKGNGNTAFGFAAGEFVTGDSNIAFGNVAAWQVTGNQNTAIGTYAGFVTKGSDNYASGSYAGIGVSGSNNVALGTSAGTGYSVDPATGDFLDRNGNVLTSAPSAAINDTVAIGNKAIADADRTVAVGKGALGGAADAIAIGTGAQATGAGSISVGTGNVVSGAGSGAIGDPSTVTGSGSYSVGNNNTVSGNNSFVLGSNVTVSNANNVVLGNDSADKAAAQVSSATVPSVIATLNPDGTVTYSAGPAITYGNFAGTATGVVSVGAAGAERQIVNVAPGAITATSTDAVNGSQLYQVASTVSALGGSITTIVNNAQTHYYSVNDGGTQQANYNNAGASGANSIAAGPGASASANNSVAVGANASATTSNSVALGNGSTTTAATPTASVTIQGQTYNFAGANPVGVVSVGSAGAERQVQNVAAGQLSATSTDAVNGSQLYATNQAINNIQAGGGIKYFHANSQAADSQAAGAESVAIGPQAIALGASAIATGNGAQANGAGSIALGASAIATSSNGVALGNGATADRAGMNGQKELFSNVSVLSTQGGVSVGSAGNERQITNVAGGTQATDAVNVRQLQAVQQSAVRYDTNVDGSVNYNSVTMGNGSSTGAVTVHNVAPGVAPTDAVNVQQLNQSSAANMAYTDARVNALGSDIRAVARNAYAGTAAAMAVQMPGSYVPGKTVMRVGYGTFKGESAVGVSFRRTAENNGWSLTGGVGVSRAGAAATVGAEWVFN